ncbi:MAG: hypothetical protein AB7I37_25090 [Pirellulales bacterium]
MADALDSKMSFCAFAKPPFFTYLQQPQRFAVWPLRLLVVKGASIRLWAGASKGRAADMLDSTVLV